MAKTTTGENRRDYWSRQIDGQAGSGQTVRRWCREAGVNEHSFYSWRKRLREQSAPEPVRFALMERTSGGAKRESEGVELTLVTGERLRIGAGADASTVRMVLAALRG